MPRAYSQDLRERVVAFVDCGHSRRAAAAHFDVSPSFVINLMTAYRLRGSLAPKRLGGRRHAKLDPHREFLLRRVAEKDDITMPELENLAFVVDSAPQPELPTCNRHGHRLDANVPLVEDVYGEVLGQTMARISIPIAAPFR